MWEKGRDEGLPLPIEAAAVPLHSNYQRRSLTPTPLPSGRGDPALAYIAVNQTA
jgi:hypothetical protein